MGKIGYISHPGWNLQVKASSLVQEEVKIQDNKYILVPSKESVKMILAKDDLCKQMKLK